MKYYNVFCRGLLHKILNGSVGQFCELGDCLGVFLCDFLNFLLFSFEVAFCFFDGLRIIVFLHLVYIN